VLIHVGRSSGKVYKTPLDAHEVHDGYVFILVYGSRSDWVQNILAAGSATLSINGSERQLTNPRLVSKDEAWTQVDPATKEPPGLLRISEFLQMDEASPADTANTKPGVEERAFVIGPDRTSARR
jgi:deazaflavin-dependent oxidoreductase (nitroreductase family)